jgi:hypothetical protein
VSQKICPQCGNIYHGRECDLCAPMERAFARIKASPKPGRKQKQPYKREWRSGVAASCPPEKE